MAPLPSPKAYKELTKKQKRAILGALLSHRVDGELPKGTMAKIARNLAVSRFAVGRLWKRAISTRADGKVHTPDVCSKKLGNNRDVHRLYDRELMKAEILAIPLWKRSTVRNLAAELKMPKSTLQDILKKEKDEVIHHHTSRLKVHLNEEQMFQRILYCFSMTRWRRTRTRQKCFYHDQMDTIHIDEKWFFMTKINNRYILVVGEEPPKRTSHATLLT